MTVAVLHYLEMRLLLHAVHCHLNQHQHLPDRSGNQFKMIVVGGIFEVKTACFIIYYKVQIEMISLEKRDDPTAQRIDARDLMCFIYITQAPVSTNWQRNKQCMNQLERST